MNHGTKMSYESKYEMSRNESHDSKRVMVPKCCTIQNMKLVEMSRMTQNEWYVVRVKNEHITDKNIITY